MKGNNKKEKKHQKILIGLMALGLVGGIGTTLALTREGANSTIDGQGTDQAIYLNWGNDTQKAAASASLTGLKAQVAEYRCLVVTSQTSTTLTGNVYLDFVLSIEEKTELTGLTVKIYSVANYTIESVSTAENSGNTLLKTLSYTEEDKSYQTSFAVSGNEIKDHFYTLEFMWDGTPLEGTDTTFGGTLSVTSTFSNN